MGQAIAHGLGEMVERDREHFHADGKGGRFKILADTAAAVLRKDAGIVIGGVDLDAEIALDKVQRVKHGAVHGAGAAE